MGLILDTSALVAMERAAESSRSPGLEAGESYAVPGIVWAEALIGVRMASNASRAARLRARLEAIRRVTGVVDFTPLVAERRTHSRGLTALSAAPGWDLISFRVERPVS